MTSPAVSPTDTTPGKPLSETTDAKPASTKAKLGSLRALWPFVRQHSALFSAWLIALAVASAATLSLPWAFGRMIDDGFSSGSNIDRAFLLLFVVAVVLALASAARSASVYSPHFFMALPLLSPVCPAP